MTRIILVSGKGGVGKTTVSASTGLAASQRGYRTLVLSFDLAHSLSDSFNLNESLFQDHKGLPVTVAKNLDIQEIDVQEELERSWKDVYQYTASLMTGGGLDEVVAEEVAILPGMDDIVALLHINEYVIKNTYDVIVVDCPPTSEALRFVSISSTLDWYVRKRMKADRTLSKLVRPFAKFLTDDVERYLPDDGYFAAFDRLFARLNGVEQLLRDPKTTSVRLVTNPEKMVVRETQRTYMYFNMYGVTIDSVVINRLLPKEGRFIQWAETQQDFAEQMKDYFDPVPVSLMPMFSNEVVGLPQLTEFSKLLYKDRDPAGFFVNLPSYGFSKENDGSYSLEVKLPFAMKDQVDISRQREDLVVRIGTFKRNIFLPKSIIPLKTAGAQMDSGKLIVKFTKEETL